jgi:hypothetical protein
MREVYYKMPITGAIIKLSAIEYITPVANWDHETTQFGFRVIYNNYLNVIRTFKNSQDKPPPGYMHGGYTSTGFNAVVSGEDPVVLEGYRNDLINALTDYGRYLIDNYPDQTNTHDLVYYHNTYVKSE